VDADVVPGVKGHIAAAGIWLPTSRLLLWL